MKGNICNVLFERPNLQAMLGDTEGRNVLNLGCGSGVYADYFLSEGAASVTCLDFSAEMVRIVKNKFDQRVSSYVQDFPEGLPKEADGHTMSLFVRW